MRWIWAAYRMGALEEYIPSGLEQTAFLQAAADIIALQHEVFGGFVKEKMMCIALATFSSHRMEPHVIWFPWATDRNKLELGVKFFADMRKRYKVLNHHRGRV